MDVEDPAIVFIARRLGVHPAVVCVKWAGQRGATPEQVASLDAFETDGFERGPFTEKEKAGFRYAGLLHVSGHAIDDAAFAALRLHFGPEEIVELTALAAAFELFSRFSSALRIPVTPLPEVS